MGLAYSHSFGPKLHSQFSAYKAVPFALIPFMLSSVCFMFFTQVSHLQPECQSEQVQSVVGAACRCITRIAFIGAAH